MGKNDRHTAGLFEGIGATNSAMDAVSNPDEVTVVVTTKDHHHDDADNIKMKKPSFENLEDR